MLRALVPNQIALTQNVIALTERERERQQKKNRSLGCIPCVVEGGMWDVDVMWSCLLVRHGQSRPDYPRCLFVHPTKECLELSIYCFMKE